jgi:hypothetical protein
LALIAMIHSEAAQPAFCKAVKNGPHATRTSQPSKGPKARNRECKSRLVTGVLPGRQRTCVEHLVSQPVVQVPATDQERLNAIVTSDFAN